MFLVDFGWVYFITQAMQTEKSDIVGKLMSSLVEVNQPLVEFELVTFLNNYQNMAQTDFVKIGLDQTLKKNEYF